MPLEELRGHLHTLPDQPELIPYRTGYYAEDWGFCLRHETLESLRDGDYEVVVDSTLADGHLTYGEHVVPGRTSEEVLISCHICHPSLANDNLAGIAVATQLARRLAETSPATPTASCSSPGTIGSITWLARNRDARRAGQARAGARVRGGRRRAHVQAEQARRHGDRPGGGARAADPGRRSRSSTSPRTATTSASTARPGSTCPSAA